MASPTSARREAVSRRRLPLLVAGGVLFVILLTANGIARVFTDYLFFDHLGFAGSWSKILLTQILLAVVFITVFFLIMFGNLTLADRLRPAIRPPSPEEDLIERYHQLVGRHGTRVRVVVSAFVALMFGLSASAEWERWLLFTNSQDFGWDDPLHQRDASFYVFRLPFWSFLVDWFSVAVVLTTIAAVLAHYLNGGIRAVSAERISDKVKLHLSGLLAVLGVLRAVSYYISRFELVNSRRGLFDGALATDVKVQLPALWLLVLVSLTCSGLFLLNLRRRGWGLPLVALGMWVLTHVVAGSIFPGLYQRFVVEVSESTQEAEFIDANISATRFAFGLGDVRDVADQTVEQRNFDYTSGISTAEVEANTDIFSDVLLVDPILAQDSFEKDQGERREYEFRDLDIDRYAVGDQTEPVAISVRELSLADSEGGWENQHIVFTHGYGVAVSPANKRGSGGTPDYLVSGIGPTLEVDEELEVELTQPRIYFGEDFDGYAIVGADGRDERDIVANSVGRGETNFRYDGLGGVSTSSLIRQLAFSLRFQSINPLISPFVGSESEVVYNRDVVDRVELAVPFLRIDSDPYPVMAQGRIKYVVDAYTTTDSFPYAQSSRSQSLQGGSLLSGGYNYVRNSVKAVVDAYDGTVSLYIVDPDDPIIAAYAQAFPDLFTDEEPPAEVADNFRYPQDIFAVQTDAWGSYHVLDPVTFLEASDSWTIATQATVEGGDQGNAATSSAAAPMQPQYVQTRLPGESDSEFVLQRAFVPNSSGVNQQSERPELESIMVARSDPENYGQLLQYRLPAGRVPAPDLVDSEIRKESGISDYITLRDQNGSRVLFGEMIMVLVEDTLVYVRPLYVKAQGQTAVPELNRIIAVNGDNISMQTTLDAALREIASDAEDNPLPSTANTADPVDPPEETPADLPSELEDLSVNELIELTNELLEAADLAESNGDEEDARRLRTDAGTALDRVATLLNGS